MLRTESSWNTGLPEDRPLPTYASTILLGMGPKKRNLPVDIEDLRRLVARGETWAISALRRAERNQKRAAAKAAREARRSEEAEAAAQQARPAGSPSPVPTASLTAKPSAALPAGMELAVAAEEAPTAGATAR